MLGEGILTILFGVAFLAALSLLLWLPRRDKDAGCPVLTGSATLSTLDAEYRHGWHYTGTFILSDGEELPLRMLRHWYDSLQEGQSGLLTWQGSTLVDFVTD